MWCGGEKKVSKKVREQEKRQWQLQLTYGRQDHPSSKTEGLPSTAEGSVRAQTSVTNVCV